MVPPKLISLLQIVFVPHRDIHDNILIAHETFSAFHKKGEKQVMAIKLEMEKAYDRLEWDFARKCFQDLGFPNRWIY